MCIRDSIIGAQQQVHQGGLARTGLAHDAHALTGRCLLYTSFQMMDAPSKGFDISVTDPADVTGFLHYMLEAGRRERAAC